MKQILKNKDKQQANQNHRGNEMAFGQNTRGICLGIFFFGIQIDVIIYGRRNYSYFDYVSKFLNNRLKQNIVTARAASNRQFSFTKAQRNRSC